MHTGTLSWPKFWYGFVQTTSHGDNGKEELGRSAFTQIKAPTSVMLPEPAVCLGHGMLCTGGKERPTTARPLLLPERSGKQFLPVFYQTGGIPCGLHGL